MFDRPPPRPGVRAPKSKVFGVVPAIVTDNNDPDGFYRVRVRFPWLPNGLEGDGESSSWARVCTFAAGADRGMFCLPEINDEVLVVFEHGDVRAPIVIGSMWNNDAKPPYDNKGDDKDDHVRAMKSRSGALLEFIDEEKKTKVTFKSKAGSTIIFDDTDGSEMLEIHDSTSDHVFKLDLAGKKITLESKQGDIFIKAKDKLKLEAEEIVTKAGDLHKMSVGAKFDVTAKSNFSMNSKAGHIEASQELTLKGQLVDINPPGGQGGSANTQAGSGGSEGGGGSQGSQTAASPQAGDAASSGASPAAGTGAGSQNQQQQQQQQQPDKLAAQWKIEWEDGKAVSGVKVKYDGPNGPKELEGGSGNVPDLPKGSSYGVELSGTAKVQLTLQDAEGNAIAGAKLKIERAFGEAVEKESDASGKIELDGFLGEEPIEVTILSHPKKLTGKFLDADEKPAAGVRARLIGDSGTIVEVTSDAGGNWESDGLLPGEGYNVQIVPDGGDEEP